MADVKIVDIDNVQWNMKDQEARNKITELEKNDIAQDLADIKINLNSGYTASEANLIQHCKVGKIHFMDVRLVNISGTNIGTQQTANMGFINIHAKKRVNFLLLEYRSNKTIRCFIEPTGEIGIGESTGITQGDNYCVGELIFPEE